MSIDRVIMRPATREDVDAWKALRLSMLAESPEAFTLDLSEAAARSDAEWRENIPEEPDVLFGLFEGTRMLGSAVFRRETSPKVRHKGWMLAVYVAPELRGCGWGRKLVRQIIEHARQHVDVLLTGASHQGAPVYRAQGFETYGIEHDALRVDGRSVTEELMALQLLSDG